MKIYGYKENKCKEEINTGLYSANEIKIGTWIDGKPIYRRVFIGTSFSEGETIYIAPLLTGVDTLVRADEYRIDNGNYLPTNNVVLTSDGQIRYQYLKSSTDNYDGYRVIAEYTKR